MKYFASKTPSVSLYTSAGPVLKWPSPGGGEGMIEVDETKKANASIVEALSTCIETGRGGDIREVTEEEYRDWQKKTQGLGQVVRRREEFSGGVAAPTDRGRSPSRNPGVHVAHVAAVDAPAHPAPAQPTSSPEAIPAIPTRRRGP